MKSVIAFALLLLTGCASYERAAWTPDGLNVTEAIDHQSHGLSTYVGFTWNLKPNSK